MKRGTMLRAILRWYWSIGFAALLAFFTTIPISFAGMQALNIDPVQILPLPGSPILIDVVVFVSLWGMKLSFIWLSQIAPIICADDSYGILGKTRSKAWMIMLLMLPWALAAQSYALPVVADLFFRVVDRLTLGHWTGGTLVSWRVLIEFGLCITFAATATPIIHRRATRLLARMHHCPECDYDLRGNPAGPCPECGAAVMQADASSPRIRA